MRAPSLRWARRLLLVVTACLVMIAILAVNILASRWGAVADLTADHKLTLADETRAILDEIDEPLTIEVFVRPDTPTGRDAIALARRYADENGLVSLAVVDPDANPGRARQLGVEQFGVSVLRYRNRRVDVTSTTEIELTSAILRLVRGDVRTVCFLEGHGEARIDDEGPSGLSDLAQLAVQGGFALEPRNVGIHGVDGCDSITVVGPRVPFEDSELEALGQYLDGGGSVLLLVDALSETDINPLTQPWGITFLGGVLLDRASNYNNDVSAPAITDFPSANPVVDDVPSVLVPAAAGLLVPDQDPRPGLHVSILARSSEDSVLAADPEDPAAGAIAGPVVVAAAADDSRVVGDDEPHIERTRLLVVSDVALATNAFLGALGNATLLANGLAWLVQDELLLTLGARNPETRPMVITPTRRRTALATTVGVVPGLLLIAGLGTVVIRRRR